VGVQHVDLARLADQLAPRAPIVVVAKHLCGAASDFALRAIIAANSERARAAAAAGALQDAGADGGVQAVMLGTCCHHRCEWTAYPNRPFVRSFLVHGATAQNEESTDDDEGAADADADEDVRAEFARLCKLSSRGVNAHERSARADGGRRAKDLLDEGRAAFLRTHGFEARLMRHVDASVTPENVLVLGKLRRTT
jgi:tRNA:m4X modification enzyme